MVSVINTITYILNSTCSHLRPERNLCPVGRVECRKRSRSCSSPHVGCFSTILVSGQKHTRCFNCDLFDLTVVQFVIGSYLEPILTGSTLSISPFAVMFMVFLWSLLWGLTGAFIGVPILVAVLTVCRQLPSMQWLTVMLSGGKG